MSHEFYPRYFGAREVSKRSNKNNTPPKLPPGYTSQGGKKVALLPSSGLTSGVFLWPAGIVLCASWFNRTSIFGTVVSLNSPESALDQRRCCCCSWTRSGKNNQSVDMSFTKNSIIFCVLYLYFDGAGSNSQNSAEIGNKSSSEGIIENV